MEAYSNSCLMLMSSLWTGINLRAAIDEEDLKDTGVELDSHITVLYAPNQVLPRESLYKSIEDLIGDDYFQDLENILKKDEKMKVFDFFELSKFENDSDYLILKLLPETDLYRLLSLINKNLVQLFGIKSEFDTYKPHMTLAELEKGTAKKYVLSSQVLKILESAVFSLDDLIISYAIVDKPGEYKHFNITSYNAVDRYFRQKELERDNKWYEENVI